MQNFKQYLEEAKREKFAPWHDRDPLSIKERIDYKHYGDPDEFRVLKDGSVQVLKQDVTWSPAKDVVDTPEGKKGLPFKFNSCTNLTIKTELATDITGMPDKGGYVKLFAKNLETLKGLDGANYMVLNLDCPKLTSFDCKAKVKGNVYLGNVKNFDVKDFVSSFEGAEHGFHISFGEQAVELLYRKPLISLLNVKPFLHFISCGGIGIKNEKIEEVMKACQIIQKHGPSRNLLACVNDLRIAKLLDYAKL
jgi:hypothetical protein